MLLYGTPTSPFTRVARIAALEFGFAFEFHDLRWRESPAELFKINAVGRIPLLVDGERRVADSRVIWTYLQEHAAASPTSTARRFGGDHRWDEEDILLQIYATVEALMVLRGMAEEPPITDHPYLTRSWERIDVCLAAVERVASRGYLVEPEGFGLAEAALISAVGTLRRNQVGNVDGYENICAVCARFAGRPSIAGTA